MLPSFWFEFLLLSFLNLYLKKIYSRHLSVIFYSGFCLFEHLFVSISFYFLLHKKRFSLISASLKFWFMQCFLDLTALMTLILVTCWKLICNLKFSNFFLYYRFTFFQPIINFKNKEQCFLSAFMKKIHLNSSQLSQLSLHKKWRFFQ